MKLIRLFIVSAEFSKISYCGGTLYRLTGVGPYKIARRDEAAITLGQSCLHVAPATNSDGLFLSQQIYHIPPDTTNPNRFVPLHQERA